MHDDQALSLLYSAADVVVVPSRIENLPQAATEAQSCGVPVVGFRVGGLPEVVDHGITGFLATPYDATELAHGIGWTLRAHANYPDLSVKCRAAAAKWAEDVVVRSYCEIYDRAVRAWNFGPELSP
jgi:glycosyltransferase involved in cell wall biosynthesis